MRGFSARVRHEAAGRWPDILERIGIPSDALTKRNKPCPACGGVDRFSFLDKSYGAFVCRGLDRMGGDGFALIQHFIGCDFKQAARLAGEAIGLTLAAWQTCPPLPPPKPTIGETAPPQTAERRAPLATWERARPVTRLCPVWLYLHGRGLQPVASEALRYATLQPYWHNGAQLGRWPAMVARVSGAGGEFVGVHRTYLTHTGGKAVVTDADNKLLPVKKLSTVREGVMRGAAIRLFAPFDGRLAIAEGIETALAVHQHSGVPAWACVSAFGVETLMLPDEVSNVFVCADNDPNGTGQTAAARAARRFAQEGRRVRVLVPPVAGMDWLDVVQAVDEVAR
ncbi:hypothetical protein WI84_18740 [Burkholderia ubonensis]|nr:hypothetical protein WI84_18740 [Burkholderia ubonensis]